MAQYLFAIFYMATITLVFRLLIRTKKVPAYVLAIISLTSRRIHSIYVLRLFNDPIAMLLLYGALNMFCDGWWTIGSILYRYVIGSVYDARLCFYLFSPSPSILQK